MRGIAAFAGVVLFASVLAVVCVAFGLGYPGGTANAAGTAGGNGAAVQASTYLASDSFDNPSESLVLESTARRDISTGLQQIAQEEEAARIAAEEAARAEEQEHIRLAAEHKAQAPSAASLGLEDVDFSMGKVAFIDEWGTRIDAYLAGSPLAGYGSVFASAAWEYGVDPRFSPAISNTESTKGLNCFFPYNAWGWMKGGGWSNWNEAIDAHVAGLAEGYGYTISVSNAAKYCPPTYLDWYEKTLAEMQKI